MRTSTYLSGLVLAGALAVLAPVLTNAAALPAVVKRMGTGINGMGFASIIIAVLDYLKGNNAYVPSVPNKCAISMYTSRGVGCETYINCGDTDKGGIDLSANWQACYLGGRQYFTDPHTGDFSITFSKAGGKNGDTEDGLHTPILQLANIKIGTLSTSKPTPTTATTKAISAAGTADESARAGSAASHTPAWTAASVSTAIPSSNSSDYAPGRCTMHVQQYQRNENGIAGDYAFDVIIYDAKGTPIGLVSKHCLNGYTKFLGVDSNLPYALEVIAKGGDNDPVAFAYAGENWISTDTTHCQMGGGTADGYDSGSRSGNCGFTCN